MQSLGKMQANFSQSEDARQWLEAYLRTRAHLASHESEFHCDPACTRPGCKNQDLQVPVSLVDLLGAARHRDEPVAEMYRSHYVLGLFSNDRDDWIRMVSLRLKKPCPFLENDLCGIYPVRPLACMLFPEYLVHRGTWEAQAGRDCFKDYLCLHRPLELSPERTRVVAKLISMLERELCISSFFLFDHGPCHIDFSNLMNELSQGASGPSDAGAKERPEPWRLLPDWVMEQFFQERMAHCPPFDRARDKIDQLDNPEGEVKFLEFMQDELLMKKLRQGGGDRALVFRFIKGKLKAKRRGIIPSEYKFYG